MNFESIGPSTASQQLNAMFAAPTHYEILNVDVTANRSTIRESYLRLRNLYTNGGDALYGMAGADDLSRHLEELERAFDVLNDEGKRAAYDRSLQGSPEQDLNTNVDTWTKEADLWKPLSGSLGSETIQTSRSTLKITKTKASGSHDEGLQAKFMAVMDDSDMAEGAILVRLREIAGVSQEEIQERTKISLEYIRSMENNRFDRLPQVVYVKGFMRSYLRYLNVPNLEKIVSAYAVRLEAWQAGQKV
jgi:curved DNA-binding protein CbpA